jgi:hypothetical protein
MDFLTLFPYVGIIVLVIINTILVVRRDITVDDSEHKPEH